MTNSLTDFLSRLTATLAQTLPTVTDQMNWLMVLFPSLPDEEKSPQGRISGAQGALRGEIEYFVENEPVINLLGGKVH